jgi:hypothetical protein
VTVAGERSVKRAREMERTRRRRKEGEKAE